MDLQDLDNRFYVLCRTLPQAHPHRFSLTCRDRHGGDFKRIDCQVAAVVYSAVGIGGVGREVPGPAVDKDLVDRRVCEADAAVTAGSGVKK